jgi:hypothetical protein
MTTAGVQPDRRGLKRNPKRGRLTEVSLTNVGFTASEKGRMDFLSAASLPRKEIEDQIHQNVKQK